VAPSGRISSPQAPQGALADRAAAERHVSTASLAERRRRLDRLQPRLSAPGLWAHLPLAAPQVATVTPDRPVDKGDGREAARMADESAVQQRKVPDPPPAAASAPADAVLPAAVQEGAMTSLWAGDALLLARRVRVDDAAYVQGCWLDWPRLRRELAASIQDLLPGAHLERADGATGRW
jgi:hypothetical protein